MNRRSALAGFALSTAVAGCLDWSGEPDEPVASPALVEVTNNTGVAATVRVVAERHGERVHDERYTIEAVTVEEGDEAGSYVSVDGVQVVEDWMASTAAFEFRFAVPEYGLEASFSSSDPIGDYSEAYRNDLEGECYFVRVAIGDERDVTTPKLDATPGQVFPWAVVYDHDIFDRPHAGDCT